MANDETLLRKIEDLQERLALMEDRDEIQRLQNMYGFYIDNRMWAEMAALFAEDGASMEIGRRGNYVGKDRIHRFLHDVLGAGRWGLLKDEIINHIQMQMVLTVADDRQSAKARCRAIVQGNSPPGSGKMLWAEGVYENEYVTEDGAWKIKRLWWVPTFYTQMEGFDTAVFQTGPESTEFPPDVPSQPQEPGLGRSFLPFHYRHPFTGSEVPVPVAQPASE
jgi:SnoaL-like domain